MHLSISICHQQDRERLRWYFEDYLQYPQDPAPTIARQVEGLLTQIGIDLFGKIFKSNSDAHKIWSYVLPILNDTRVEIVTNVQEATSIPWELICNPDTLQPLHSVQSPSCEPIARQLCLPKNQRQAMALYAYCWPYVGPAETRTCRSGR